MASLNPFLYDFILWLLSVVVDLFFREVHPRSSWKIPRNGPVIFVGAPHANQFIDPLLLMRVIRSEAKRRVSFLIAEKSMKRKFIGSLAGAFGAVSVGRALDTQIPVPGTIYLPDPSGDELLIRGVGTNFEDDKIQVGGLLVLPSVNNVTATAEIAEIKGPEEIRLKKPFKGAVAITQLTGKQPKEDKDKITEEMQEEIKKGRGDDGESTTFKVAPKVDQTKVYEQVFKHLKEGGCIGIYPEGGSHDRTELLPLKAGVAIMALGALAENPDCGLKVVPCGMNYFHAHKFRSRAVIEFGAPVEVPPELVEEYKNGSKRDAVGKMLDIVYNALVSVTVTSPDYETLMMIQAVRRLYNPKGKRLPLPMIVELNRRLVKGYTKYRDDPRIVHLKSKVLLYNRRLRALNLRDHQVQYAKLSIPKVIFTMLYRLSKLILLAVATLPGLVLFAPVFAIGKYISIQKAKEALAASTVKIQARDVVATWKLLVAMALAPTLYTYYIVILVSWTYYNRIQGYVPEYVKLWQITALGMIVFPSITFAALRMGEIGMDIAKSLRPLALALNPFQGNSLRQLRLQREDLVKEVTQLINELGPEMFPDFESARILSGNISPSSRSVSAVTTPARGGSWSDMFTMTIRDASPSKDTSETAKVSIGGASSYTGHLPPNDSFLNLGAFGFFASRPTTPHTERSRSRPSSSHKRRESNPFGGLKGMSPLDAKGAMDDVTSKIRGAMRERGQQRARRDSNPNAEGDEPVELVEESGESSGVSTPGTDGITLKKNI